MDIKQGNKTSEFLVALMPWIVFIFVLTLMAMGKIDTEVMWAILAFLGIGGSGAGVAYINGRNKLKGMQ